MLDKTLLADKFNAARDYAAYLATGTDEHRRRWAQVYDATKLTDDQRKLVAGFGRQVNVLVVSGIWCGDCVQQVPLIQRIGEANPEQVRVRIIDRDEHKDLSSRLRINGGDRVPVVVLMAEDFELCAIAGDRTLRRYRAIAMKQLGPACPIAIGGPDLGELAETLQDWLDEIERVHLMLRLSTRLRQKHGD